MKVDAEPARGSFPTTQWSLVRAASWGNGLENRDALARLLTRYVPALHAHLIRQWRLDRESAEDLVQSFLADKVLGSDFLALAQPGRGKFRNLLAVSLDRYVISHIRAERAKKRSGGTRIEFHDNLAVVDAAARPDRTFDVSWARQVLSQAIDAMRAECTARGRPDVWGVFQGRVLRPVLQAAEPIPYIDLVKRYGFISPSQASNVLVTANRMFARELRKVVGAYACSDAEVDAEIADLRRILSDTPR